MNIKGRAYRIIMRIAHKYNWHYAPPIYPDGDTHLWCKWCGFRATIHKGPKVEELPSYQDGDQALMTIDGETQPTVVTMRKRQLYD